LPDVRLFEATELRLFLTAVDEHLADPATIIILGGCAIALYGAHAGTIDIDTFGTDLPRLSGAIDAARAATGLDIPVSDPGVADVPLNYTDRLHPIEGPWTRLRVLVLDRHDLTLSKTLRGRENDLAAIAKLHHVRPLDVDILISRYLNEMEHVVGNKRDRLDPNFVLMIERIHGEIEADRAQELLSLHRRRTHSSS
jgi:hypothetical protein